MVDGIELDKDALQEVNAIGKQIRCSLIDVRVQGREREEGELRRQTGKFFLAKIKEVEVSGGRIVFLHV